MRIVADLHIHSHYSRATSKDLTFEHLARWAQLKGVHVVGTGDIAHPGWLEEMKEKLESAEDGLFRLKADIARQVETDIPPACRGPVRFMLAGEISSIYKKNDRVRKIHNVIFAPTLNAVEKIQAALEKIGNIRSDGRPILGLDSRDLLEIILDIDPQNYLIPAHIWTPWFSLLGSKSGFDSVEECFNDLTSHIFALETGLSSDPPMNWRVSALDRYTLVSNSDAHSPQKLAREANLFNTDLSYPAIFNALKTGNPNTFLGTIEFFPEEGKYHLDGHRKCNLRWTPRDTLAHNGLCPVCGKPVTVGVLHRVETLADRPEGGRPDRVPPFYSLIPLPEVLAEVHGVGPGAKRVRQAYEALLTRLGPELDILLTVPLDKIEQAGGSLLAEGIRRMRAGQVIAQGGFDGEYGIVRLFEPEERAGFAGQLSLFAPPQRQPEAKRPAPPPADLQQTTLLRESPAPSPPAPAGPPPASDPVLDGLNPEQRAAVLCTERSLLVVAGPGTGKTRVLTHRIAYLVRHRQVNPASILAITFTNKAAEEMFARLTALLGPAVARQITVKTFHAFGAMILHQNAHLLNLPTNFALCTDDDRRSLLRRLYPALSETDAGAYLLAISAAKNRLETPDTMTAPAELVDPPPAEVYGRYEHALHQSRLLDYDDLLVRTITLFETHPNRLDACRQRFRWISVDEYQDINLAQYRLLKLLTTDGANLCVIGDPNQAIYGFRGASREYFLAFQHDYPQAQVIHLTRNYRSTQLILDASGQVISRSREGQPAFLRSDIIDPARLVIYRAPTDRAEAEYVVHQIESMVGGTSYFSLDSGRVADDTTAGRTFADFAVLYRLNALSRPLIEAFERSGIPYQAVGQTPLAEYKEIKTLLACLWLVYQPGSLVHLTAALDAPALPVGGPLSGQMAHLPDDPPAALDSMLAAAAATPELASASRRRLEKLAAFLPALARQAGTLSPVEMIEEAHRQLQAGRPLEPAQLDRLGRLKRRAAAFDHLPDFLEAITLEKETDAYDPRADRVTLMTLHASKGLEFPVVFIVGCEDSLLPYRRPGRETDVEEERRLFYVGMTRAQQRLILTHACRRYLFGEQMENPPSLFLNDIEARLKEIEQTKTRPPRPQLPEQLRLF